MVALSTYFYFYMEFIIDNWNWCFGSGMFEVELEFVINWHVIGIVVV